MIKRISLYISDKHQHLIIVPNHENNAGIIYEQENCFSSNLPIPPAELGNTIIDNLNNYSAKDKNLREHKLTDWPAFKHSKSKSVKAFKEEYIVIYIGSENSSNLILEICGLPFENGELKINSTISFHAKKEELGERVLQVYEACRTGKLF